MNLPHSSGREIKIYTRLISSGSCDLINLYTPHLTVIGMYRLMSRQHFVHCFTKQMQWAWSLSLVAWSNSYWYIFKLSQIYCSLASVKPSLKPSPNSYWAQLYLYLRTSNANRVVVSFRCNWTTVTSQERSTSERYPHLYNDGRSLDLIFSEKI